MLQSFLGEGWDGYLNAVIRSTFGVIALLGVIGIGYYYAKAKGVEGISGAAVSLVAFLIISPQSHDFIRKCRRKSIQRFCT